MKKRKIELSFNNRKEVITLPVNPANIDIVEAQLNEKITLLNIGEANLFGNRGLATTSLSSFFPSKKSPFYKYAEKEPKEYVSMIKKWKDSKSPVRLIISGSGINLAMAIDNFTFSIHEGDDDIYYTIDLSEYRSLNVRSVKSNAEAKSNGLKERPNTRANKGDTHIIKPGDTLWKLGKKYYDNGSQCTKIYKANSTTIEAAAKKHGKSSSLKGYYLYTGTKLNIT